MTYTFRFLGVTVTVGQHGQKSWSCLACGTRRRFTAATAAALRARIYSAGCCFRDGEGEI